ncbi:MAG: amidohydrolase family protein [Acidimicrobiaceae bacterium]|nr:amidohydrolase family protein [Acidimicrobiaceae bacterium]
MRQLITDAIVVTGDGVTDSYRGDALIEGDRIVHLGRVPAGAADDVDRKIDAAGRVLAPGFVDTHNHGALGGTRLGDHGIPLSCEMALRGGVTKRICGVDGLSPAPVAPDQRGEYAMQLAPLDGTISSSGVDSLSDSDDPAGGAEWTWSSTKEFLDWHRGRSVTDMGLHLGHSAVRRVVMGNLDRTADDQQISDMAEVVRREAPWCLGLSTGLVYNPAVYSDQREITALVRAFNEVKSGALYPHLRSESDDIEDALDEVITAAADGGGGYCSEHTKIAGRRNWDRYGQVAGRLDDAAGCVPTMGNMYPYTAGSTTADALFPPEVRSGTRAEFMARLRDADVREFAFQKIFGDGAGWDNFVAFCGGLEGIQIAGVLDGVGDEFLGKRFSDVVLAAGVTDMSSIEAHDAVCDFFLHNRGEVSIISHYGNEATVERFFRRSSMAICTDGLMPGPGQKPHPRLLGAFPKALRMARELGVPLVEIVHRMTALPCEFMGLPSPVLRPGADASLVLFDWDRVAEHNSYTDPMVHPEGIEAVWVHGELLHFEGRIHAPGAFGGRHLLTPPTPT